MIFRSRAPAGQRNKLAFLASMAICLFAWAGVCAEEAVPPKETYPGLNEVVPRSTDAAARLAEAGAIIDRTGSHETLRQEFIGLTEEFTRLEEQFANWEDVNSWPLNRLITAEARYARINEQQQKLVNDLSGQFSRLEDLRYKWTTERNYWSDWKDALLQAKVKLPDDTFQQVLQGIDTLLERISSTSTQLVLRQKEFSPQQETLAGRIALIETALTQIRQDTFRRNTYSLFSLDFYRQFNAELIDEYLKNFTSTIRLPDDFWYRQGWVVFLQLICVGLLAALLTYRKRQPKPISGDWRFLFKHPLAGAIFATLALTGGLYDRAPPSWEWLLLTIATVAGAVLVISMAEKTRRKKLVAALAVVYLFSEALNVSGLPTPAYQLYIVILCALAAPLCFLIARKSHRQEPGRVGVYICSLYLLSVFALLGLITALMGFSTLAMHLIDTLLGTIIVIFIAWLLIQLADGGITEVLRLNWVRDRRLVQRLGIQTGRRLKTLAHVFIMVHAGLFMPVMWGIYNDVGEVTEHLLNLEYTIGEFSISVHMVVTLLLVLYLTNLVSWVAQAMADAYYMSPRRMDFGVKTAMKRLLHYALFTVGFFVAVSMAGLELQRLTIIAGALSVGIGFGLQNIVNNFVSGLILLFERPVKVGDTINIDDQWGTITKIGLRSTIFETLDRSEIIVPNSDLISQKVTNWTFSTNISRVTVNVGVAYGSPLDKVLEILQGVALGHPDILKDPEPSAIFTGFGDSSIDFEVRAWISDISKRPRIKSEMGQAIDRAFREEDISIPFPQRDLHLRSIEPGLQGLLKTPASPPDE